MDIPRQGAARERRRRRVIYGLIGGAALVGVSAGVAHLKPAAPEVERTTVWTDTVRRGPMDIQVRSLGTLVPEDILWIPALTDGRVNHRLLPGVAVRPNTILLELSNPELEQATLDAGWQLKQAVAEFNSLKAQLDSQLLDQRVTAATVQSDYQQARLTGEKDEALVKLGLQSELNQKLSAAKAGAFATRNQIETERVKVLSDSIAAQLAAQQAKIEQLRALYNLKRSQLDSLRVRAGAEGVLQEVLVEVGQRVAAGTILAKVAQPTHLKAQLKIAETQAKDVLLGEKASIDTHNGVIAGHVVRIDPSVINGTRTVDVKLDGPLPAGAVPDLSVDGTIQIEHLESVLHVGRPAFGQPKSIVGLFKLVNGGKEAVRVQVKLGRASVSTVEILNELREGDEIVLSDMSRWDGFDRIRLQ
ncbi:MAG: efflux RND transporter periplasmic adaptor subunit [Acidobacteriia bacterium]|nr:efflux RND transporter periplasmic adaptor subunit [Terriglobia bacterium]